MSNRTTRAVQTAFYLLISILLGLFLAVRGALLPNLAEQTGVGLSQIGIIITASSLGFMTANITIGRLFDRYPGHSLMAAAMVGFVVILAVLPLSNRLAPLFLLFLFSGFFRSMIIMGTNTLTLWIYHEKSAAMMNALAGAFGAGSFVGPLLAARVLANTGSTRWMFWGIALSFLALIPAAFLIQSPPIRKEPVSNPKSLAAHTVNQNHQVILLMGLLLLFYVGAEVGVGSWITAYGQAKLPAAESQRAFQLASAFWLSVMAGRFLSAPLSIRIGSEKILGGSLFAAIGSLGLLLAAGGNWPWMMAGTLLLGFSMAPVFPLVFAFAEETMDVTGRISSLLFIGASTGALIFPLLMGKLIETINPASLVLLLLVMAVITLVIFFFLYLAVRRNKTKHQG